MFARPLLALVSLAIVLTLPMMALADPPAAPGYPPVFCFRVTDIIRDGLDPELDRVRIEFEILNWADTNVHGLQIALNTGTDAFAVDGAPFIASAAFETTGRPIGAGDDNANFPPVDGTGMPAKAPGAANWIVSSTSATEVIWLAAGPGESIPPRDLLSQTFAGAIPLVPGCIDLGVGIPSIPNRETVDNGLAPDNVLDGFYIEIDDYDLGEQVSLNWFMLQAGSTPIGSSGSGNPFGWGVMNIANIDSLSPVPTPAVWGRMAGSAEGPGFNTGGDQDIGDLFVSLSPGLELAAELGSGITGIFKNPADNIFNSTINGYLLAQDSAYVMGRKWQDDDRDGLRQQSESTLANWQIDSWIGGGGALAQTTTTNANGYYTFTFAPGSYSITEAIPANWLQSYPPTQRYPLALSGGDVLTNLDFGNFSEACSEALTRATYTFGVVDSFALGNTESPNPGADFIPICQSNRVDYDVVTQDLCFLETITGWPDSCFVVACSLTMRLRAHPGATNDAMNIYNNGQQVYRLGIADMLVALGLPAAPDWVMGEVETFVVDLANLPASTTSGVTNGLGALQDGDLDVRIADDTSVDYLRLDVTYCCGTSIPTGTPRPSAADHAAMHTSPNPFRNETLLRFELPVRSEIEISVYDIRGREVRTLANESRPAGSHVVSWDGRDESGKAVGSGVYFVRMSSQDRTASAKVVITR